MGLIPKPMDFNALLTMTKQVLCAFILVPLLMHLLMSPPTNAESTRQDILKGLLYGNENNTKKYDNRVPPHYNVDRPTSVTVQIYLLSLDSVSEATMVNARDSYSPYSRLPFPQIRLHEAVHTHLHRNHPYSRLSRGADGGRSKYGNSRVPGNGHRVVATHQGSSDFSVSIFLRQKWTDNRLDWSNQTNEQIKDHLEVDPKLMEDIWVPDLYFANEKEAIVHDVTVKNKLLHIKPPGDISHSIRVSMTLNCDMLLDRYPHDEQTCFISLGSYGYSRDNVVFKWDKPPIILRPGLTLPRFKVWFDRTTGCQFFISDETDPSMRNYSCIQANFKLRREFGYYIAQVYVPSVLIVILSWVSFWIDIDATPARVSLGLLTVLTMTTQSTGEKATLPRVSYLKAIDVWMSTCLFFVFAALLEFAYVNVQSRVEKRRSRSMVATEQAGGGQNGNNANNSVKNEKSFFRTLFRGKANIQNARLADKISRIAFPGVFIVFNIGYWIYYR